MHKNPNIKMLEAAVERLGPLIDEVVFLGGCATGLLLTDPAAPPLRVTRDVDVMVEVASLPRYHKFNEKLREQGFVEDTSPEAPICRWHSENLILDVMPTDPELLGFGNIWFARAFTAAQYFYLSSGVRIRVLPSSYFLATKIEAFDHRGGGDLLLSRDVEDLITVLDGRSEIVHEVQNTDPELLIYIAKRFAEWLNNKDFRDVLPGHLPPDEASQARVTTIIERMEAIVSHAKPQSAQRKT
jgi:hypothetical protein